MNRKLAIVMVAVMMSFGMLACKKSSSSHGHGLAPNVSGGVIEMIGGDSTGAKGYAGEGGAVNVDWLGSGGVELAKAGHINTDFPNPKYPDVFRDMIYGANSLEVSADMAVSVYDGSGQNWWNGACPGTAVNDGEVDLTGTGGPWDVVHAGQYHLHFGSDHLYLRNATNDCDIEITGLIVDAGKKLTLGLNNNNGNSNGTCNDLAYVWFDDDVVIEGTVTTDNLQKAYDFDNNYPCYDQANADTDTRNNGDPPNSNDMGALNLQGGRHLVIGEEGVIDTRGKAQGTLWRGGDGGGVFLWADGGTFILASKDGLSAGEVLANGGATGTGTQDGGWGAVWYDDFTATYARGVSIEGGMLINNGIVTSYSGGGTRYGGMSGNIELYADTFLYNYGDLDSHGGNGGVGYFGGNAGSVYVISNYSGVYNEGNVYTYGGAGGPGGNGGDAVFEAAEVGAGGKLVNRAEYIVTNGGNATGTDWDGGNAGDIGMYANGDELVSYVGGIFAIGGSGITGGDGGDGGEAGFFQDSGFGPMGSPIPHGDAFIAANSIFLNGGAGYNGGDAGDFVVDDDNSGNEPEYSLTATAHIIGFSGFEANGYWGVIADGGSGVLGFSSGSNSAGGMDVETHSAEIASIYQPVGPISNDLNVQALGGVGSAYPGGDGGYVYLRENGDSYDKNSTTVNNGILLLDGGNGVLGYGGNGGYVSLWGFAHATNNGAISALSGNCTGAICNTHDGGDVEIMGAEYADNNAEIDLDGGNGVEGGGDGGNIRIVGGTKATNSGYLSLVGGNTTGTAPTWGGWGGDAVISSQKDKSSSSSGRIDVNAGTGTATGGVGGNGMMGHIYFDLLDVTPSDGIW